MVSRQEADMSTESGPSYIDGNGAAGLFGDVFAVDIASAVVTCGGCGRVGVFADHHVYTHCPGVVVRCPSCDQVAARMVRTPTDVWLDFRGSVSLRLPAAGLTP
jgi:Family of unknown function (DUF6510)